MQHFSSPILIDTRNCYFPFFYILFYAVAQMKMLYSSEFVTIHNSFFACRNSKLCVSLPYVKRIYSLFSARFLGSVCNKPWPDFCKPRVQRMILITKIAAVSLAHSCNLHDSTHLFDMRYTPVSVCDHWCLQTHSVASLESCEYRSFSSELFSSLSSRSFAMTFGLV